MGEERRRPIGGEQNGIEKFNFDFENIRRILEDGVSSSALVKDAPHSRLADGTLDGCYGAATVLVVAFDRENVFAYPGGKRNSGLEAATIVATHMLPAAKNAGVESCRINNFDPEAAARALGLPKNEEVLMLLDRGYPAEGAKPLENHFRRKPLTDTVTHL